MTSGMKWDKKGTMHGISIYGEYKKIPMLSVNSFGQCHRGCVLTCVHKLCTK